VVSLLICYELPKQLVSIASVPVLFFKSVLYLIDMMCSLRRWHMANLV